MDTFSRLFTLVFERNPKIFILNFRFFLTFLEIIAIESIWLNLIELIRIIIMIIYLIRTFVWTLIFFFFKNYIIVVYFLFLIFIINLKNSVVTQLIINVSHLPQLVGKIVKLFNISEWWGSTRLRDWNIHIWLNTLVSALNRLSDIFLCSWVLFLEHLIEWIYHTF